MNPPAPGLQAMRDGYDGLMAAMADARRRGCYRVTAPAELMTLLNQYARFDYMRHLGYCFDQLDRRTVLIEIPSPKPIDPADCAVWQTTGSGGTVPAGVQRKADHRTHPPERTPSDEVSSAWTEYEVLM